MCDDAPRRSRTLRDMFPEMVTEVDLLFGGRSGSVVLTTTVKHWPLRRGDRERISTCCVVKVDRHSDMEEEVEKTEQIVPHLGEVCARQHAASCLCDEGSFLPLPQNAPRVLCNGARYEKLDLAIDMGKRDNTHTIGTLAIELVGAAWVAPEFMQVMCYRRVRERCSAVGF